QTANLSEASASEEDKIKAMMIQPSHEYDPINYMKKPLGPPPSSYTCHPCRKPGHSIKNCPINGQNSISCLPLIISKAWKSFPLPIFNLFLFPSPFPSSREAFARRKKEKPPFLPEEPSSSSSDDPIPDEILCLICKEVMTDAAIMPCCGNSYCDECIRTALLESEEHRCPECHQTGASPDALVANKCLRRV
ncbi:RBBP6 ligase, partial [Haliaeetus albicilla]|nr:RBBP6 ligase [Haliaeetus albicilla]